MKGNTNIRRSRPLAALVLWQALLILLLNLRFPALWPHDDAFTYFEQGVRLWLGGFPPDPARPICYPFLISLVLRGFGLSIPALQFWQGGFLLATTILAYRLARVIAGPRAGLIAAALIAFFPDALFYSAQLYRESMTAFFFILTLNLIQIMMANPARPLRAVTAGLSAGGLVLIKPEFGLLMALLALAGAVWAIKDKNLKRGLASWLICGLIALATIAPAVLAARAHFGEWIFLNTYQGYNYSLSYCGRLDADGQSGMSFSQQDNARYQRMNPFANQILFFSDPAVPFRERDRSLMQKAKACIRAQPGQALTMLGHRFYNALFSPDRAAVNAIRRGNFGPDWPAFLIQVIRFIGLAVDLAVLALFIPGVYALSRRRAGLIVIIGLLWFLGFYATVFYLPRFRIGVWPALAVCAGCGAASAFKPETSRRTLALVISGMVLLSALFCYSSPSLFQSLFKAEAWRAQKIGAGLDAGHKQAILIVLGNYFIEAGDWARLQSELGPFLEQRRDTLEAEDLMEVGRHFSGQGMLSTAGFFLAMADRLFSVPAAGDELGRIHRLKRERVLSDWEPAGVDADAGLAVYSTILPEAVVIGRKGPPLETRLWNASREFKLNPEMFDGVKVEPYQYAFRGRQLWIILPREQEARLSSEPLHMFYYAAPESNPPP